MIIITGATGTLGRSLVPLLRQAGAEVHALSRHPRSPSEDEATWPSPHGGPATSSPHGPTSSSPQGLEPARDDGARRWDGGVIWHRGDLTEAPHVLGEAATIVHLASDWRTKGADVAQTRGLLQAARPDAHIVYISIVGIDDHPFPYYRSKLAVERLIEDSGRPFTILRATQFHEFLVSLLDLMSRGPALVVPSGSPFQPIAVAEVAERLAGLTLGAPAGRVPDLGGPGVHTATELARTYLRITRRRRLLLPLPVPGATGRALRSGRQLAAELGTGQTWEEFLSERSWETFLRKRSASPRSQTR